MPLSQAASAAIQAGATAGSGVIGSWLAARQSRENTNKTISANKEMADYQYSKDLEMWNKNNAYNSPEAQQERLKAAGLNPNLVYGSGSVVGNTSGQMPKYNAPTLQYNYRPFDPTQIMGMYQDFKLRQAQIDNVKAETDNKRVQNLILTNDSLWRDLSNKTKIELNVANQGLTNERKTQVLQQNYYAQDMLKTKLDLLKSELKKSQQSVENLSIDKLIKQAEAGFYQTGGKYFEPIFKALKIFIP